MPPLEPYPKPWLLKGENSSVFKKLSKKKRAKQQQKQKKETRNKKVVLKNFFLLLFCSLFLFANLSLSAFLVQRVDGPTGRHDEGNAEASHASKVCVCV